MSSYDCIMISCLCLMMVKNNSCLTLLVGFTVSFVLQNYRYLDLLGILCVCEDVALEDNQNYILDHWLRKESVSNIIK